MVISHSNPTLGNSEATTVGRTMLKIHLGTHDKTFVPMHGTQLEAWFLSSRPSGQLNKATHTFEFF